MSDFVDIARPVSPERRPFPARSCAASPGRFRSLDTPLAYSDGVGAGSHAREVNLASGPVSWLRLAPRYDPRRTWTVAELEEAATGQDFTLAPYGMGRGAYSIGAFRDEDGFGAWVTQGRDYRTLWASFIFTSGEIWGVDALTMNVDGLIRLDQPMMAQTLTSYRDLLRRLWIDGPYLWTAGMEGTRGRSLAPTSQATLFQPEGLAQCDEIVAEGELADDGDAAEAAASFFARIHEACGLPPPQ